MSNFNKNMLFYSKIRHHPQKTECPSETAVPCFLLTAVPALWLYLKTRTLYRTWKSVSIEIRRPLFIHFFFYLLVCHNMYAPSVWHIDSKPLSQKGLTNHWLRVNLDIHIFYIFLQLFARRSWVFPFHRSPFISLYSIVLTEALLDLRVSICL